MAIIQHTNDLAKRLTASISISSNPVAFGRGGQPFWRNRLELRFLARRHPPCVKYILPNTICKSFWRNDVTCYQKQKFLFNSPNTVQSGEWGVQSAIGWRGLEAGFSRSPTPVQKKFKKAVAIFRGPSYFACSYRD